MRLDVYRSCTWREKRQVLETFWHSGPHTSARIQEAAAQYGPYAIAALALVAIELAVIFGVALSHHALISWIALVIEVAVLVSIRWAVVRTRSLSCRSI
ncbi:MAG TPA: hypothetical protein VGG21_00885 [Acidimicrobiales bacterium]|jgi:hypothetical protein